MSTLPLTALIFAALIVLLSIGLPISFSLGFIAVAGLVLAGEVSSLSAVGLTVVHYGTNWMFITLPLFVFMAEILVFSEAGAECFEVANKWVSKLPGGLAVASVVGCGIFSAANGSSTGTAAAIGLVALPEMEKRGYSKRLAAGALAAGGTLGILIPPSGVMVLYGILTGASIGDLFMAGVIPGIMMVALFSAYVIIRAIMNPTIAPSLEGVTWSDRLSSLYRIWPIVVIALFVMGGLYTGAATPTEVGAVGAVAALFVAFVRHKFTWAHLKDTLLRTVVVTCFVYFIVFGAMMFGTFLSVLFIPQAITNTVVSLSVSPMVVMIIINLLLIFLGCFIDPGGILVLTVPLLYPIIMKLGWDPVWFGIILTMNMEMGNITPPVGLNLFVIRGIAPKSTTLSDVTIGAAPFVVLLGIGIAVIVIFPQVAMWLPSLMWK